MKKHLQDKLLKKAGRPQIIKSGKVITIHLENSDIARLDAIRDATGENRSAAIRRLIKQG